MKHDTLTNDQNKKPAFSAGFFNRYDGLPYGRISGTEAEKPWFVLPVE